MNRAMGAGDVTARKHGTGWMADFSVGGGDILTLQRILGHGDIKMTMRYAHLSPGHLVSALNLSPLAQLRA